VLVVVAVLVVGVGIVAAGSPSRAPVAIETSEILDRVPHQVDPNTFPAITVNVEAWDGSTAVPIAQDILLRLAENLELENQALLQRDPSILAAADHGDRLAEMQARVAEAEAGGLATIERFTFEAVNVVVISPFGVQTGGSIGFESRGTVVRETVDATGTVLEQRTDPFELTFALRRPTNDRWLIVAVLPPGQPG
jgi:hypothetical protein